MATDHARSAHRHTVTLVSGMLVFVCTAAGAALGAILVAATAARLLNVPIDHGATLVAAGSAAALSAMVVWRLNGQSILPAMLWLVCLGVVLCAVDLQHHRLPDALVGALFAGGVVLLAVTATQHGEEMVRLGRAVAASGAVLGTGLLALLAAGPGLGRGDVTFSAALALYLGARGWQTVLFGFVLAALMLAAAAALVVAARGGGRHRRLAAGPALLLGAVGAVLVLPPGE